jgi:hypothetical protein
MNHSNSSALSPTTKKVIVITAGIAGAIVGMIASRSAVQAVMRGRTSDASIDKALVQVSTEINKNLPMVVDRMTRLDSTAAMPGKKLHYKYTLIGVAPTEKEILSNIRPLAVNNYKTSTEMLTCER